MRAMRQLRKKNMTNQETDQIKKVFSGLKFLKPIVDQSLCVFLSMNKLEEIATLIQSVMKRKGISKYRMSDSRSGKNVVHRATFDAIIKGGSYTFDSLLKVLDCLDIEVEFSERKDAENSSQKTCD